ncbi:exported hypothetical protein [Burkholderiales bacterium]|nr:exported hypothetical protein [Burkholderiales bacterium]
MSTLFARSDPIFPVAQIRAGIGRTLRARTVASIGALLCAACTSVPTAKVDSEAVTRYRDSGYPLPAQRAIETHRVGGSPSELPWAISLTRPTDGGPHPLIVYLPSLGQADNAPNHWIGVWARAGYDVIAIQPLNDDAQVWATDEARSGDFERVASARFRDALMAERLARLSALLGQIRQRSLRGELGLERLDWSGLALAGADLGAFTVQTIASSPEGKLAAISWPLQPLAYIAISPYAVRNGASAGPANAPVLMISARDDVDAYGVIKDPSLRRLAFDRLGDGDNYYFELGSATHRWLGGTIGPAASGEPAPRHAPAPFNEGDRKNKRGGTAAPRDAMAPGGDDEETSPDKSASNAALRAELVKARSRALTHEALSEVSFAAVSVAFLDAYLRRQAAARAWLAAAAPKWLQEGDRLKHR